MLIKDTIDGKVYNYIDIDGMIYLCQLYWLLNYGPGQSYLEFIGKVSKNFFWLNKFGLNFYIIINYFINYILRSWFLIYILSNIKHIYIYNINIIIYLFFKLYNFNTTNKWK